MAPAVPFSDCVVSELKTPYSIRAVTESAASPGVAASCKQIITSLQIPGKRQRIDACLSEQK